MEINIVIPNWLLRLLPKRLFADVDKRADVTGRARRTWTKGWLEFFVEVRKK